VPKKPSGEFYSFDEVLSRLKIDEQKLKRLVSEGEIRAFREGDEMKFKKSDIDNLNVGVSSEGETREVDLSASKGDASETLTDDLIFDEGDELDLSADDAGLATAEISSQDTFVDEGGEPVGMSTEPLDVSAAGLDEVEEEAEEAPAATSRATRTTKTTKKVGTKYQAPAPVAGGELLWGAVLVLSILVLLFAGFTVWSSVSHQGINNWSASAVKLFAKDDYMKYIEPNLPKAKGPAPAR
jgi:excisionase family DNA binding protein